jgi:hypothetical protein
MTARHLVECGVSIAVSRNEWGQLIIDLKSPESNPQVRFNNQPMLIQKAAESEDPGRPE